MITEFFQSIGCPVVNQTDPNVIVFRLWQDETRWRDRKATVLLPPDQLVDVKSPGFTERIGFLQEAWAGKTSAYAVLVEDGNAGPGPQRVVGEFRRDKVFFLDRFQRKTDGSIVAGLGKLVLVGDLLAHAQAHRTAPGLGDVPAIVMAAAA